MIIRWRYYCSSVRVTAAMITRWHYYIDAVMIARWRYCLFLQYCAGQRLNTVMTTLYVDNVETTGERCCHLSPRTPLNSALCTFIGMKQISHTFMYIIPMYFRLTAFTKTLPEMSFDVVFFAICFALYYDSVDCWSAHISPAARDSFKHVHH